MYSITEEDKTEALIDALAHREREVFNYQINIDNYTLMLENATGGYAQELNKRISDEKREQAKGQAVLTVVTRQLEASNTDIPGELVSRKVRIEAAQALAARTG